MIFLIELLILISFIIIFLKIYNKMHSKAYNYNNSYYSYNKENYGKLPKYSDIRVKYFFTQQELKLFHQLKNYLKDKDVLIFSKVRIADLVTTKYYLNKSNYFSFFGKASQRHIDFVITDFKGRILCLIELDGNSHDYNQGTIKSDQFKNELFANIGLPLIRFKNYQFHNFKKLDEFLL